jgi:hypothetical protein
MPIVQDLPGIAQQVEIFFNSSAQNATIQVILLSPINDVLNLNITKIPGNTLQDLLNIVISRITLYLKNCFRATITKNNITTLQPFNSASSKLEYIKYNKQYFFQKYLASNLFSGRLSIK